MSCPVQNAVVIQDPDVGSQMAGVTADGRLMVDADLAPATVQAVQATIVSVDNTVTSLLAADPGRTFALIQNHGASELRIRFGVADDDALILPQYATLELRSDGVLVTSGVWGIRDAAAEDVGIAYA